jgi:hypothetical protein
MAQRAHRRLDAIDVDVRRVAERTVDEQLAFEVGADAERIDMDLHAFAGGGRHERHEH